MTSESHGSPPSDNDISLEPTEGWHCLHAFFRFHRSVITAMEDRTLRAGGRQWITLLDPTSPGAPARVQTSIVSGTKADFGLLVLDPDPLKIDRLLQQMLAGPLGPAIEPTYSFVSMTEVSEYLPTVEQYARRLIADGESEESATFKARIAAYGRREPVMRRARLMPELPAWPATCFYPMNKRRNVGANWFTLPFSERSRMMSEHGRSGMLFSGKVSQLVTVGLGLDDWEWGVTLWARNPQYLKDIVYRMRFDEASALYADFGPFLTSYVASAEQILSHCRIGASD